METTQTPGAGHNLPLGTDPTYILETLKADHGDLIKRKDDLVASVEGEENKRKVREFMEEQRGGRGKARKQG